MLLKKAVRHTQIKDARVNCTGMEPPQGTRQKVHKIKVTIALKVLTASIDGWIPSLSLFITMSTESLHFRGVLAGAFVLLDDTS